MKPSAVLGLAATLVVVAALIWLIASSPKAEPGTTQQTGGAPSANTQPMQQTTSSSPQTSTPVRYIVYMATTTSVKDTGLLDVLIPDFEKWARASGYDVEVRYTAVGTGQALQMAQRGDVDVVIVHAPSLEAQYLKNGTLKCRDVIAYNFFIVVGPRDDPAGARGNSAVDAFKKIAEAGAKGKAKFVSRGDKSGTNLKEIDLWKQAIGRVPDPQSDKWYISAGAGMGQTLQLANQEAAYTLSDTGTWYRFQDKLPALDVIVAAAPDLINIYSFEIVKPSPVTKLMAEYMLTRGQEIIGNLTVAEKQLFIPITRADPQPLQWMKDLNALFGPSCVK
ncbi:MAG: substrate-binding domain-containing protein [Pyrobaculum arsenaticum]|uniref:substrate-binding domain-containing protein n=1 Tax=Pyrobaculum arsenaticum TaxID=121277 RepID=UPI002272D01C|nr:substrate-binding domain-containing protein [Pyrobaculum arsenaticum]